MADEDEEEDGPTFRVGDAVVDGDGRGRPGLGKVPGWWKIQIPSSTRSVAAEKDSRPRARGDRRR